jgi:ADP-heptose:LPS heptosyltransferase
MAERMTAQGAVLAEFLKSPYNNDPSYVWSETHPLYRLFSAGLKPASFLVCKLDHLGDFSLGLEAMFALRDAYPEARIVMACAPWNTGIAQALELFDEVVGIPFFPSRADAPLPPFDRAILEPLEGRRFDVAIDLRTDPDTRVVLDYISAKAKFGYESDRCREKLTLALPLPHASVDGDDLLQHQSMLMLRLVQTVLAVIRSPDVLRRSIRDALRLHAGSTHIAGLSRPLVAVCTGSGRKAKDWPIERFRDVVTWLCDSLGASVVLLGSAAQLRDAAMIERVCPSPRLRSLVNKTSLREALGVVGEADLFVGNDTSLTHYAARLGVATVGIFSGIDPTAVWAPVGENVAVIKAPVPCSPCHILQLSDCRNRHACMDNIPVESVKRLIRKTLLKGVVSFTVDTPKAAPRVRQARSA